MRKYLPLLFLLFPVSAFGQGARFDSTAQRTVQGFLAPIPGATVTVCTSAGSGTPCTPITPIYTDQGLTQQITGSVVTADSLGNFGFWAPAGSYTYSITATGVTGKLFSIVLSCFGVGACTVTGPLTVSGTATFNGVTLGTPSTVNPIVLNDATGVNGRRLSIGPTNTNTTASAEVQLIPGTTCTGLCSQIQWFGTIGNNFERMVISAFAGAPYIIDTTKQGTGIARDIIFEAQSTSAANDEPGLYFKSDASVWLQGASYTKNGANFGSGRTTVVDVADTGDSRMIIDTHTTTPGSATAVDDSLLEFRRGGVKKWLCGLNATGSNNDSWECSPIAGGKSFGVTQAGDFQVPSAGTSSTSVATLGATQTLTNKSGSIAALNPVDLTAQQANIGTTTITTPAANGYYRVACSVVTSQAATTSSTLPAVTIGWTDGNTSSVETSQVTSTSTLNTLGVMGLPIGTAVTSFYAKSGVAITYATNGYASSGATPMQYAIHVRLEGPF